MRRFLICLTVISLCAMGCVEDRLNYNQCKTIEDARCHLVENCRIDQLEFPNEESPFESRYPNFELEQCISHAREHCGTLKLGKGAQCADLNACADACAEAIIHLGPRFDAGVIDVAFCDDLNRAEDETLDLTECDFAHSEKQLEQHDADGG